MELTMKKILLSWLIISVTIAALIGGVLVYKNIAMSKQTKPLAVSVASSSNSTTATDAAPDPTKHDTFDIEFSKKLLLYHQLAAKLDSYAMTNATRPEIRAYANQKNQYNVSQAAIYSKLLDMWNEKYTNLDDYPKVTGSACSGYPTFPGMLSHSDVSAYLQSTGSEVDKSYLALMIQHHNGITSIVKAEGHFVIYGDLVKTRDAFFAFQDIDSVQLVKMQKQLGYA